MACGANIGNRGIDSHNCVIKNIICWSLNVWSMHEGDIF